MITSIQITQMAVGSYVTLTSAMEHLQGGTAACYVDAANYKLGFAMYASYFVLFSFLFYEKYFDRNSRSSQQKSEKICGVDIGSRGAVDTAGRFEDFSRGSASPSTSGNASPLWTASSIAQVVDGKKKTK